MPSVIFGVGFVLLWPASSGVLEWCPAGFTGGSGQAVVWGDPTHAVNFEAGFLGILKGHTWLSQGRTQCSLLSPQGSLGTYMAVCSPFWESSVVRVRCAQHLLALPGK